MASDSKTRLHREAEKYVLQGKISQAIGEYLKIVKTDPDDVLILNTIGDLYLRQGRISEANRLFYQVAENYIRNNFLLKAIAVFKKVLASDPCNLELNTNIASLYARQGMNVDARIQYLHVAEMCAKQGKTSECLEAYEKVVELDPMNVAVELKLADTYLRQGNTARAHLHLAGAARAQTKAGDLAGAMKSYQRALEFDPCNTEVLRGLLDTATQTGDVAPVLDQLSHAVSQAPGSVDLRELLGRAFLAANDVDSALGHFEIVLSADDSRVENFLLASKTLLQANDADRAAECLEPILPILIGRREPDTIVGAYHSILELNPTHVLSLKKLADTFAAINDQARYLNTLDKLADHYAASQTPAEALSYLARILEHNPDSPEHLKMHREIFTKAYPGTPYVPPVAVVQESPREVLSSAESPGAHGDSGGGAGPNLIEIDLLINYGMKDKALQHLLELEGQDPLNKQVRSRLFSLYKDMENNQEAAKQCLLTAALERKAGKEEAAEQWLADAKKLSPEMADDHFDLVAFAEKHGISMADVKSRARGVPRESAAGMEVDLSGDLSEIFFRDGADVVDLDEMEVEAIDATAGAEDLSGAITKGPASVAEQLQEVDFYIRLGFQEEAKIKLAEIAKEHPDHPELASRFRMLGEAETESQPGPEPMTPAESQAAFQPGPLGTGPEAAVRQETVQPAGKREAEMPVIAVSGRDEGRGVPPTVIRAEQTVGPREDQGGSVQAAPPGIEALGEETGVNEMFADLIDEVNALTDQEIAREDFETHFSLGIAYREMNLIDDAIKEFQGAIKALNPSKSPREAIQCCGMLSTCYLDKGMPRSAIRWCQTALSMPDISSHEKTALQYDMAVAHALAGENERALECFSDIFGIDPTYRDVAQRIDDLKAGHVQHAPPDLT